MELQEARRIVREFCSQWTTQKCCEVLAFAEDGKMRFDNRCKCLIGVASSNVLHDEYCGEQHYAIFKYDNLDSFGVESAYWSLHRDDSPQGEHQARRDFQFIAKS